MDTQEYREENKETLNRVFARWRNRDLTGKHKPTILKHEIEILKIAGYAVMLYPNKKQVCVNGCQYYQLRLK